LRSLVTSGLGTLESSVLRGLTFACIWTEIFSSSWATKRAKLDQVKNDKLLLEQPITSLENRRKLFYALYDTSFLSKLISYYKLNNLH
jgi:hypothetical protein